MLKTSCALILFFVFSFFSPVTAQTSYKKLKSDASEFYRIEEYQHALPLYLKVDSIKPNDPEVNYRIGICYYNTEYKLKAQPYLIKAKKLEHEHQELDLMLAKLYHLHNDFDSAVKYYNNHRQYINPKSGDGAKALKELDMYIAQCATARLLMSKPLDYEITNLGPNINSSYSDYAPVISADEAELIFTSKRNSTTGGGYDELNDCYYEDVYVSTHENNQWTLAKNIGPPINTNEHDAGIGLSPDGQKLFIYRSDKQHSEDIFVSDLEGSNWKTPVKLNSNINTDSWESHASVTSDEQTMYFTSDKPGGKGRKDIYISRKQANGDWGPAEDLSPAVNTEYDEDCPFIHTDGKTLYFSSTGHQSMGGYDIFKTVYNEQTKTWSEPENVGYPLNTTDDDLFLVWSADGKRAYFSSIRPDTYGEKDIYMAKKKDVSNFVVVLKGKVVDKATQKPISALINVHNLATGELVGVYNSNSATGKYIIVLPVGKDFSVTAEAPGHVFHSEHINVTEPDKFVEYEQVIAMESVLKQDHVALLNNVFFDYDKSTLRPQSKTELDKLVKLLKANKNQHVEIAAHTDSVATHAYNHKLSNARAKSVVRYLVENGIDSTKLFAIGYGEDFPKSSNITPEGRQQNRRSEFIFVEDWGTKKIAANSYYHRKERQANDSARKAIEQLVVQGTQRPVLVIKDNKYHFRLYFNNTQTTLTDSAKKELLSLVPILQENKGHHLQVKGFADAKITNPAYQELQKKRFEDIRAFFVSKGIPAATVIYKNGHKKVYTHEAEHHALNSRIELLINIRNIHD